MASALAAGALLQSLAIALQSGTSITTYIGTIALIALTLSAHLVMKLWGSLWRHDAGIEVRLKGLGPSQVCFVIGIILLLWYPRARDLCSMSTLMKLRIARVSERRNSA